MSLWKGALALLALLVVSASYGVALLDAETIWTITVEDGPVETIGAFSFLAASAVCFVKVRRNRKRWRIQGSGVKRETLVFWLGLFFFVCCMEEISWGQRYLNVETPAWLARWNLQGDINIHNTRIFERADPASPYEPGIVSDSFVDGMLDGDRLFNMFWLGFGVVLPLLNRYSKHCRVFFSTINMPVLPIAFAFLFLLNYVLSRSIPIEGTRDHPWVEIKEANCALLLMIGFLCLFPRKSAERYCESGPAQST